eukprot:TRINITY_DN2715_c0_g1_i1.p1 TRINITY_DN2715_c0_g1~~TRINITY_DN2715_c0_g1_i1.p1  ORF type:complete len:288 (-),score=99.56 TRINITY_DN2715_c0_g1_i1:404-1267(-)
MEALPIFLNRLVPEYMAIILSVTAVLIFGEVGPQAICTGPSQFKIASALSPLAVFLMMITSIVSYPLSKILDMVLGEHGRSRYHNQDLKALIELHSENALKDMLDEHEAEEGVGLSQAQARLINGTIDLISLTAEDVMKPFDEVTAIDEDVIVDEEFLRRIMSSGFSRYPVYKDGNRNLIMGVLLSKKLIGVPITNRPLRELGIELRRPLIILPSMCLTNLMDEFQKGKSHMALITKQTKSMQRYLGLNEQNSVVGEHLGQSSAVAEDVVIEGMVTLEDVIEKAMGG